MTLHSAKGLEFDAVFLCGVEESILPHQRSLDENPYSDSDASLEEERRLLHVGMTRARKRLSLTYARERMIRGEWQSTGPSRFLDEFPDDGVERHASSISAGLGAAYAFAEDAQAVIRRKQPATRTSVKVDKGQLEPGGTYEHKTYGEGTIVSVETTGKRHLVRVDFPEHGVLTLLL
jgi:DNA helicase-2/ATP-dependent DNA helicase PcrA